MSVKAAADQTYENLKTALSDGKLPPNVADTAVKLCERLHEPVRVSVMGLPGSGKSTVVNLLLNKPVVPEGVSLPTSQFVRGDITQAICTLPDGTMQALAGDDAHEVAALDPIFVEFHMQLPALGRISVLEVVAPEAAKDQQRAMHWAAKRTDMALWCTKTFTSIEQALWGSLPEKVKDHAFMLLTHADQVKDEKDLNRMVDEIRFGSEHEFNKIMPIATTDALAARRADGSTDKPLMQKSGGLTLISSILRQVDSGLQATIDQADLILHKFKDAASNPEYARTVEKVKAPRVITKPSVAVDLEIDESKPVIEVVSNEPVATGNSRPIEPEEAPAPTTDAFVLRGKSAVYNPLPPETAPEEEAEEPPQDEVRVIKPTRIPSRPREASRPVSQAREASRPLSTPKPISRPISQVREPSRPIAEAGKTGRPFSDPIAGRIGRPVAPVTPIDPDAPKKPRMGFRPKVKTTIAAPRAKPETCAAYAEAIAYLTQQGKSLTQRLAVEGDLSSEDLMTASADNITWLSDYLEDLQVSDDPVLEVSRTRALDATETIQLMQFEKNESAGLEALTLVIQLKRDLETEIARSRQTSPVKAA